MPLFVFVFNLYLSFVLQLYIYVHLKLVKNYEKTRHKILFDY